MDYKYVMKKKSVFAITSRRATREEQTAFLRRL